MEMKAAGLVVTSGETAVPHLNLADVHKDKKILRFKVMQSNRSGEQDSVRYHKDSVYEE